MSLPQPTGTLSGSVHRGWLKLQAVLTGGDENTILAACLDEEQTTQAAYRDVLETPLPKDVRTLLERHFESILRVSSSLLQWENGLG